MGRTEMTTVHHFSHGHPLQLVSFTQAQQPNLKTQCCGAPFSSWTNHGRSSEPLYACEPCNFYVHKGCLQLPQLITHPSHPAHPLTLLPVCSYPDATFSCDACSRTSSCFSYNCAHCSFDLHVYCASMPLAVSHGSHPHRLSLCFACPYPEDGDFQCDLCRGKGGSAWLYRCAPCGFDAHLDCASRIGPVTGVPAQPMVGPRAVAPTQPVRPYSPAPNYQFGPRPPVHPFRPSAGQPYAVAQAPGLTGTGLSPQFRPAGWRPVMPGRPQAAQAQAMAWNRPDTQPTMAASLQLNFGDGGGGQNGTSGSQSQDSGDAGEYCSYEAQADISFSGDGEAYCTNSDEGQNFVGCEYGDLEANACCLSCGFNPIEAQAPRPHVKPTNASLIKEDQPLNAGDSLKDLSDTISMAEGNGTKHVQAGSKSTSAGTHTDTKTISDRFHSCSMRRSNQSKNIDYAIATVEHQIHKLRSLAHNGTCNDTTCQGKGIFVYDLPPKFNKEVLDGCADIFPWMNFCGYLSNQGLGHPVHELGSNWYATNQFSLELIFHSRIKNHPCRVLEEEKASLFYIPFYAGLNAMKGNSHNSPVHTKDQLGLELVEWIKTKKSWVKNQGRGHFIAVATISWDLRRKTNGQGWGTNFLELNEMQNPIKLIIERQPWHRNDVGIPYPTNFHPTSDQDIISLQSKLSESKRKTLISFAGSGRPRMKKNIRRILIKECMRNSSVCTYLDCKVVDCVSPGKVVKLLMESEFCLQPPGDSPTRKSFFDSLVYGCIPVVFDPFTAHFQYPWHLPEDCRKYSVSIDQELVKQGKVDVMNVLSGISIEERRKMRRYIIFELMPRIIYANYDSKLVNFRDAFEIAIDNMLRMAA
ncbi:Xyloglucan-specific galacturonosyltransferase [Nymphaea thermarum]|nr:Xyloglucan-specific galacturonosyltransferase [Nymphaea thermarum]